MQKLCLLKLVRPECLVAAIHQYVITSLGPHFAEPGPVSLKSVKKDSNNTTPIIFILSPGGPAALTPAAHVVRLCSLAGVVVVMAAVLLCGYASAGGSCSDVGRHVKGGGGGWQ